MTVSASVSPSSGGRKAIARLAALHDGRAPLCQIGGSSTLRRTQSVKNAGRMPTKNTARHPKAGWTSGIDERGGGITDRPAALHEAERLATMLRRPGFGDERGTACPLPSHADPEERCGTRRTASKVVAKPHAAVKTE